MNNTIIGAPFDTGHPLRSILADHSPDEAVEHVDDRGVFKIRFADSFGHRSSAGILVSRMYATRGYQISKSVNDDSSNRITLVASDREVVIGTLTVRFDSKDGLLVDTVFPDEAAALRKRGHKICEFTKLAVDTKARSKRVLASLFHVAYIFAHRLKNFDSVLIEVNPRHVRYYGRMLGFKVIGPERLNLRVNAPAVLLCLELGHAQQQIGKFAGLGDSVKDDRSLYPYFFSVEEEAGIVGRLHGSQGR